jgi:hypothetical protein
LLAELAVGQEGPLVVDGGFNVRLDDPLNFRPTRIGELVNFVIDVVGVGCFRLDKRSGRVVLLPDDDRVYASMIAYMMPTTA